MTPGGKSHSFTRLNLRKIPFGSERGPWCMMPAYQGRNPFVAIRSLIPAGSSVVRCLPEPHSAWGCMPTRDGRGWLPQSLTMVSSFRVHVVRPGMDLSLAQELSLSPDGKRLVVGKPEEAASAADGACPAHDYYSIKRASRRAEREQKTSSCTSYSRLPLVPLRHLEALRGRDGGTGSEGPNLTGESRGGVLVEWLLLIVGAAWFPALLTLATVAWWTGIWG